MPSSGTLTLRSDSQAALWSMEICGQLSDGHWENSRPWNHWMPWCDAKVVVDPKDVGRDFYVQKDRYGLTSKILLDIVGQRMERYARLAIHFGLDGAKTLEHCLDLEGGFQKIPDWVSASTRKEASLYDMGSVRSVVEHGNYGRKDLLHDLRDIKSIMRIHKGGAMW